MASIDEQAESTTKKEPKKPKVMHNLKDPSQAEKADLEIDSPRFKVSSVITQCQQCRFYKFGKTYSLLITYNMEYRF
jgi:hypothetical protein